VQANNLLISTKNSYYKDLNACTRLPSDQHAEAIAIHHVLGKIGVFQPGLKTTRRIAQADFNTCFTTTT